MKTAKDLQASFGRRKPNQQEVEMLHQLRQQDVEQLLKKNMITVNDIMGLDWGGRFAIANRHFDKCDDAAKQALLHDQHGNPPTERARLEVEFST